MEPTRTYYFKGDGKYTLAVALNTDIATVIDNIEKLFDIDKLLPMYRDLEIYMKSELGTCLVAAIARGLYGHRYVWKLFPKDDSFKVYIAPKED